MNSLIRLQEDINKKINRGFINFKKSPNERVTVSYVETRLDNLEKQWSAFDQAHQKLICDVTK